MPQGVPPVLEDFIGDMADNFGMETGQAITLLKTQYGFDATEVSEDDAEAFVEAFEDGDKDATVEVLEANGATAEQIDRITDHMEFAEEHAEEIKESAGDDEKNPTEAPSSNGATPSNDSASSGPSHAEVRQMIREETPSAADIASEIKQGMAQESGGGGDGGVNPQQQMALKLITEHLGNSGGGGQMAELGQQFQKAAMSSYLKKLSRPSLGEIVEMRIYEDMADEYADEYKEKFFEGEPMDELAETDDDGDSDGWFNW